LREELQGLFMHSDALLAKEDESGFFDVSII